jgi:formate dehydrogenase major subunit
MTNHWVDLKNAKAFLIGGSNAAENHVMSMKWIRKAQENGAVIVHVDPRFTRTSAIADEYARIRPGTDIAYLGAIISYVLREKLYDKEYVETHTNALSLVGDEFGFEDGVFNSFDEAGHKYDKEKWAYALGKDGKMQKADSLDDPRCALQKVARHYERYTFEKAEEISGIPAAQIKKIADILVNNRPATILYALGMTQHTVGVQNIRSYAVLQLLLGNIGKPGGGVNALRGEPNVQGASDMALLSGYLPGYLYYPSSHDATLEEWTKKQGTFRAKMMVNLLKAWYGDAATKENDFAYSWLPKTAYGKGYTIYQMLETALAGKMKLLWVMGQNPMVTNPNLKVVHEALGKLDMLVVQDLWETETAAFWQKPGCDPAKIDTEVLLLPAAYFMEKEGTIAGSGRMVQWRYKAVEPPGQAKGDLEILDTVFKRVRKLYEGSTNPKDAPILSAVWNYKDAEAVLQEIGGRDLKTGKQLLRIPDLQSDGSTSCGAWIYAGVYGGEKNLTKRRDGKSDPSGLGIYPGFAWTWPGNMHVLYNRASCDKDGKPFAGTKPVVWWDAEKKKWAGHDTPDVAVPTDGPDTPNGQKPFRMNAEGVGRLLAVTYRDPGAKPEDLPRDSSGVPVDGPLPEFYEPVESPTANALHPNRQSNPTLKYPKLPGRQPIGKREQFPFVLCTASLAEHWCAGSVTRNVPKLNELSPEPFIELPEQLAKKLSVQTGDKVKVSSARGAVEVKAVVTARMKPLTINGKEVTTVYMPYNWGFKGLSTGPSTNDITIDAGDPNTQCQETKACLVNVEKVSAQVRV